MRATTRRPHALTLTLAIPLLAGLLVAEPAMARSPHPRPSADARASAQPLERHGRVPFGNVEDVAPGTVGVRSAQGYIAEGIVWVSGEIWNRTSTRRTAIEVTVTFVDANDNPLVTESSFAFIEQLAPGGTSPFLVEAAPPPSPAVAAYIIDIASTGASVVALPLGAVTITEGPTTIVGDEIIYSGTVYNPMSVDLESVDVNLTVYNSAGGVIEVWWAYVDAEGDIGSIPAGQARPYEVTLPQPTISPIADHAVISQGWKVGTNDYATSWNNFFNDLANTSFRDDIAWLAEQGITTGCAKALFCPNADVARDQMASFIARAVGLTGTPIDYFTDDNGNTHELNINRIRAAGITTGCGVGLYCPAGKVQRDQMASFLSRAVGLTGTPIDYFTDDNGNSHELNINRIRAAGITTGCGATTYCPTMLVTRGQMAAFLHRAFD
jgi:hypothetical protein